MNFDPVVHQKKAECMQRICDYVLHGYYFHTSGTVTIDKIDNLVRKFAYLYAINAQPMARTRRKENGLANAHLILYYPTQGSLGHLRWFLLVTGGENNAHHLEKLQDTRKVRITFEKKYELVQLSDKNGKVAWTWRLTESTYSDMRNFIQDAIRIPSKNYLVSRSIIPALFAMPGFRGIRSQIGQLCTYIRYEWRRSKGKNETLPAFPKKLYYVNRRPNSMTLSQLLKKLK